MEVDGELKRAYGTSLCVYQWSAAQFPMADVNPSLTGIFQTSGGTGIPAVFITIGADLFCLFMSCWALSEDLAQKKHPANDLPWKQASDH